MQQHAKNGKIPLPRQLNGTGASLFCVSRIHISCSSCGGVRGGPVLEVVPPNRTASVVTRRWPASARRDHALTPPRIRPKDSRPPRRALHAYHGTLSYPQKVSSYDKACILRQTILAAPT